MASSNYASFDYLSLSMYSLLSTKQYVLSFHMSTTPCEEKAHIKRLSAYVQYVLGFHMNTYKEVEIVLSSIHQAITKSYSNSYKTSL